MSDERRVSPAVLTEGNRGGKSLTKWAERRRCRTRSSRFLGSRQAEPRRLTLLFLLLPLLLPLVSISHCFPASFFFVCCCCFSLSLLVTHPTPSLPRSPPHCLFRSCWLLSHMVLIPVATVASLPLLLPLLLTDRTTAAAPPPSFLLAPSSYLFKLSCSSLLRFLVLSPLSISLCLSLSHSLPPFSLHLSGSGSLFCLSISVSLPRNF